MSAWCCLRHPYLPTSSPSFQARVSSLSSHFDVLLAFGVEAKTQQVSCSPTHESVKMASHQFPAYPAGHPADQYQPQDTAVEKAGQYHYQQMQLPAGDTQHDPSVVSIKRSLGRWFLLAFAVLFLCVVGLSAGLGVSQQNLHQTETNLQVAQQAVTAAEAQRYDLPLLPCLLFSPTHTLQRRCNDSLPYTNTHLTDLHPFCHRQERCSMPGHKRHHLHCHLKHYQQQHNQGLRPSLRARLRRQRSHRHWQRQGQELERVCRGMCEKDELYWRRVGCYQGRHRTGTYVLAEDESDQVAQRHGRVGVCETDWR